MYKIEIVFRNGNKLEKHLSEADLRRLLSTKTKNPIKWAKVTTPSGVSRDVTDVLS